MGIPRLSAIFALVTIGVVTSSPAPAFAASSATVPATGAAARALTGEDARQGAAAPLRGALDDLVAAGVTGATAQVHDGHRDSTASSGVARLDTGEPMTSAHGARVGSITKTFVATVLLQLVQERRLRLDDSVERWLPGVIPGGAGISVRQLMNHTSGIYNYSVDQQWLTEVATTPFKLWQPMELVAVAAAQPPLFAPGTGYSYSNTNYVLAGLIIEAVTGDTAAGQITRRILEPLGLHSTFLAISNDVPAWQAHGYFPPSVAAQYPGLPPDGYVDTTAWSPTWAWTAGAMVSTTGDLSRFYRALLAGALLRRDQLTEMLTTVAFGDMEPYGLGIAERRTPCGAVWGHDGGIPGYVSRVMATRDGRRSAVVLMTSDAEPATRAKFDHATDLAACQMLGRRLPAAHSGR